MVDPTLRPCRDSSHLTWSGTSHTEHSSPQKHLSVGNRAAFHSSREGFASNVSSTISRVATFSTEPFLCWVFLYVKKIYKSFPQTPGHLMFLLQHRKTDWIWHKSCKNSYIRRALKTFSFNKHFGFAYKWSDLLSLSQVCGGIGIHMIFLSIYKG